MWGASAFVWSFSGAAGIAANQSDGKFFRNAYVAYTAGLRHHKNIGFKPPI